MHNFIGTLGASLEVICYSLGFKPSQHSLFGVHKKMLLHFEAYRLILTSRQNEILSCTIENILLT